MAKTNEKTYEKQNDSKTTIEPSQNWVNKTKSGKGFIIHVKEDIPAGSILLGSIVALEEFVAGERTGINLGQLIEE